MRYSYSIRRGFSLVETLAVVTLIAVLSGLTVPALQVLTGAGTLNSGTQQFAGLLGLARSEAIARHTVVRFAVVKDWPGHPNANLRKYSLWAWDAEVQRFFQLNEWTDLPTGIVFEPSLPDYVRSASYATDDGSSVRGDCVLEPEFEEKAEFQEGPDSELITMRYVEFLPSGTVRIPGSVARNAIFVATSGFLASEDRVNYTSQDGGKPKNWAQINVDTLTGRTRVYQP